MDDFFVPSCTTRLKEKGMDDFFVSSCTTWLKEKGMDDVFVSPCTMRLKERGMTNDFFVSSCYVAGEEGWRSFYAVVRQVLERIYNDHVRVASHCVECTGVDAHFMIFLCFG